jgi:hypothetical protein
MPSNTLQVIWRPEDAAEVFARAATLAATHCPAALSMYGLAFECDNTQPHHTTHTSAALRARWVDSAVAK